MKKLLKNNEKKLTADLHKLGIKTYRKKSTGKVFVKREDVKKILAEENYVNLPEEKLKVYRGMFDKLEKDLKSSGDKDAWHRCTKELSALKDQLFGVDKN